MISKDSSAEATIESELLERLSKQSVLSPIPVIATLSPIAFFASSYVSSSLWITWFALVTTMQLIRLLVLRKLPVMSQYTARQRLRVAAGVSLINGIAHGLSLAFFIYFSDFERAYLSIVLGGFSAIAVVTTAGYRPISLAYILPTLLPLALLWSLFPGSEHEPWVYYALSATIGIFYCPILVVLSGDTFTMFKGSFDSRSRQISLNNQLKTALRTAESASQSKARFLASASHDLRQPIHTLSLFVTSLGMRPLDSKSQTIVGHINEAISILANQLDSLLDVSKLDAGVIDIRPKVINIRHLVERLAKEYEAIAAEKGLAFQYECACDGAVETDELLLERIVRNLLENAIKYTDEGNIKVRLSLKADNYIIQVIDTGRGIPKQDLSKIFEEFYQVDNPERDRTKGLGLGLAIVKRMTSLLEIDLDLESEQGTGTCFTLSLTAANAIPEKATSARKISAPVRSWRDLSVLVIDDEESVRLAMQSILEEMGCTVKLTDSTQHAVQTATLEPVNIVLADFRLRGEDNGIQAIQAIRNIYPDMPALLISGDTDPKRIQDAAKANIELLHKPVKVELLVESMCKQLKLEPELIT